MEDKLNAIKQRFDEVNDLIIQPDVIADQQRYIKLNKEYKELEPLVQIRKEYLELKSNISEAKNIVSAGNDPELKEMALMELDENEPALEELEEKIKWMLIP